MLVLIALNVSIPGARTHTLTYSESRDKCSPNTTRNSLKVGSKLQICNYFASPSRVYLWSPELSRSGLDSRANPHQQRPNPRASFLYGVLTTSLYLHPLINQLQFFSRFHVHFVTSQFSFPLVSCAVPCAFSPLNLTRNIPEFPISFNPCHDSTVFALTPGMTQTWGLTRKDCRGKLRITLEGLTKDARGWVSLFFLWFPDDNCRISRPCVPSCMPAVQLDMVCLIVSSTCFVNLPQDLVICCTVCFPCIPLRLQCDSYTRNVWEMQEEHAV